MKEATHIAYVCADRGVPIGGTKGASAHVAELTRALQGRGAELRILAARTAKDGPATTAGVIDVGADRALRLARQQLFADARSERGQAQASETHAVMLNHLLAKKLEQLHGRWRIDAIYERYSLWSYAAAGFAQATGIPYLIEVNAPLRAEQRRYRTLQNPVLAATIESYLLRAADTVLVPSSQLQPYVLRQGARSGTVVVTPNAADPTLAARTTLARAGRDASPTFVIGFLGTLKPWHGLTHLVRAFRRLHRLDPSYRLLLAGDGPLRSELERDVRRHGLGDAVTFTGEVAHAGIATVLAQMDVAVAPYPRLKGFYFSPLKIFEYMAAGVPVVASDIGQVGEVLVHGKTALLHRPAALSEMVDHIEKLRRTPRLAASLARAAQRLVTRRYTWDHNAQRVLALIETARAQPTHAKRGTHGSR